MQEMEQKIKWSYDTLHAIKVGNYDELIALMQKEKELNSHIISSEDFFQEAITLDESNDKKTLILDLLSQHFSFSAEKIQDYVWVSLFGIELDTYEKRFPLRQRIDYLPATTSPGADYFQSFQFLMGRYFTMELVNDVITQLVLFEHHKEDALVYLLEALKKYDFLGHVDKYLIMQAYSMYQFKSFEVLRHYFPIFDFIDDTHLVYYMAYVASQQNKNMILNMIELLIDFHVTPETIRMKCFQADQSYLQPINHFYDKFNEFLDVYQCFLDSLPVLTDIIELPDSAIKSIVVNDTVIEGQSPQPEGKGL